MKKFFLLALIVNICIYPMDDMILDEDPQNTPSPVWKQITWLTVPAHELSLNDRVSSINRIISTLSDVIARVNILRCNNKDKTEVVQEINFLRMSAIATIEYLDHVVSTPLESDDRSSTEATLKQFADSFLDPYHKAEDALRRRVEDLEGTRIRQQEHLH